MSQQKSFRLLSQGKVVMEGEWGWNRGQAGEWIRKTFVDPSFPPGECDAVLKNAFVSEKEQVHVLGNEYELQVVWT